MYHFNVLAFDGKLTGYAEVKVALKDINDNVPVFRRSKLHGSVMENSPAGLFGAGLFGTLCAIVLKLIWVHVGVVLLCLNQLFYY